MHIILLFLWFFDSADRSKLKVVIDSIGIVTFLVHHVGNVCVSFEIESIFISFIVTESASIVLALLQVVPSESELVLETHLTKCEEHGTDTLSVSLLELIWRHVQIDAQLLQLKDDILTRRHGIVVLAPTSNLVVVQEQQPRDDRDEVDELLTRVRMRLSKVGRADWLEALLLAELVLVVKKLEHVEDFFHHDEWVWASAARHGTCCLTLHF